MKSIQLRTLLSLLAIAMIMGSAYGKDKKTRDKEKAKKAVIYEYASFQYYYVINPQIQEMMEGDHIELEVFEYEQKKSRESKRDNGRIVFNYGNAMQKGDYEYSKQRSDTQNDPIQALNFLAQRGWTLDAVNSSVVNNLIIYVYVVKRPKQEKDEKDPDQAKN
jgi:hypothetical protein